MSPEERFWPKVEITEECWQWTAHLNACGYGLFKYEGTMKLAHRVAYEWMVGPIPGELEIDHLCRNRGCVKPDHLEPVTHQTNMDRSEVGKWNRAKTHCPKGHEYNEANTRVYRNGRVCRTCDRERRRLERAQ